ncbi:MAG TPA: amidohydrolase family protein [Acidobacteriaceae bacterium]|jgi:predicted TIM-barrel fold metal-dependent hydrolase|nr:amidohydrolase family protein [Acidobacteriaceae bacterium]
MKSACGFAALVLCVAASGVFAQQAANGVQRDIDPAIAREIASTQAIDNHAHPMLSPPDDATDREFDALPVDNMAPQTDPVAYRADYPPLHDAWKALFGVDLTPPLDAEGMKQLEAARARVKAREGAHYSAYVLDKAGIGTMVANRVAMGNGVEPPRFLWVPYEDALLFPLDNSGPEAETPDRAQFFVLEDKLRARYLREARVSALPATLDDYVERVVLPTLERQHAQGAIAAKFELAYLRGLDIGKPTEAQAAEVYAKGARGGVPDAAAYKQLQDYLFRVIAKECGRLGMAVHFHALAGAGSYFSIAGVNPLNLEPVFNDPEMRGTNFVLLHGGWPFVRQAGALLQKPNVYLDISQQAVMIPARTLAIWLREWLELYPDKVLFGTDGYPYSAEMGWEESTWLAAKNAREALGLALTGMERDGEITPVRAAELARRVLRGNAERLYRLKTQP